MKRFIPICSIFILMFIQAACRNNDDMLIKDTFYDSPALGFRFNIPDQWRAIFIEKEDEDDPSDVTIKMTDPDNETTLVFTARKRGLTPKEAALLDRDRLRDNKRRNPQVLLSRPWFNQTQTGYILENTISKDKQRLFQRRIYISNKPMIYQFILTAPDKEIADIYNPVLDALIDSIVLTKMDEQLIEQ